jgi:hypothetical protein
MLLGAALASVVVGAALILLTGCVTIDVTWPPR